MKRFEGILFVALVMFALIAVVMLATANMNTAMVFLGGIGIGVGLCMFFIQFVVKR